MENLTKTLIWKISAVFFWSSIWDFFWQSLLTLIYRFQYRGGSRTPATSKVELFVIIVNGFLSQRAPPWILHRSYIRLCQYVNSKHVIAIGIIYLSWWMLHKIWYILIHVVSILINDSIFKLMMPIEGSILLKHHFSCNFMLKYCVTVPLQQFMKTLNQCFV